MHHMGHISEHKNVLFELPLLFTSKYNYIFFTVLIYSSDTSLMKQVISFEL